MMSEFALEQKEQEQLSLTQTEEVTYSHAVEVHCQVMIAREQVLDGLFNIAKNLKAMRDDGLYKQLGYSDFDDYIDRGVNIQKRQVYYYISTYEKLGESVLQSNAQLGITKLALLATVPSYERDEFMEQNDLAGMSTKELEALIKSEARKTEQITLLTAQMDTLKSEQVEQESFELSVNDELERVKEELAELKAKPVDIAVEQVSEDAVARIKVKAKAAARVEYEKQRERDIAEQVEQVEAARLEVANEYKDSIATMEAEKAAAAERAERLAQELSVAVDADMTTVQFLLDEFTEVFSKLTGKISEIQDREKAAGLFAAVGRMLEVLGEQVGTMVGGYGGESDDD